jgi:hypothetical protein
MDSGFTPPEMTSALAYGFCVGETELRGLICINIIQQLPLIMI